MLNLRIVLGVTLAIAAIFLIDGAFGRKCYVCNSAYTPSCADWFDNRTHELRECSDEKQYCSKLVQQFYHNNQWEVRYIRGCAALGAEAECSERTGTYRVKSKTCFCTDSQGCNSASRHTPYAAVLAMLLYWWFI